MLVVKVELHSAITGKVKELCRMQIFNKGGGTEARADYGVRLLRRGTVSGEPVRQGTVENYPRKAYNVWRLVSRALRTVFPEEANWSPPLVGELQQSNPGPQGSPEEKGKKK